MLVKNIVDLINANENDEKSLIDFESTSFSHAYTQTNVTTDFTDLQEEEFITTNLTVFKLQKEITLLQPGTREWFANNENFTLDSQTLKFWMHCFYIFLIALLQVQDQPLQNIRVSLTLMRLWLNLMINDLAYHFNASSSTASSTFLKVIDVLFLHLKPVIKWPC